MATDLKMPKEVLDRGYMERINLRLFLKHSSKESGVLRQYLLDALELKGITLRDYIILVATTKIQIFHCMYQIGRFLSQLFEMK
jgi:hypothetical protein